MALRPGLRVVGISLRGIKSLTRIAVRSNHNQIWSPPSSMILYRKKSLEFVKSKVTEAVTWYEHFTGINEVRLAQSRVVEATQMLRDAQERRRAARIPLNEVQKRLQHFLPELRNTPRGNDRYLELLKEEHECVKEQQFYQAELQQAEADEREAFELLSNSLRASHETERAQAERTKYWSLLASIIGTVIGVVGSTLNNSYKMKEFKNVILETNRVVYIREMMKSLEEFSEKHSVKADLARIQSILEDALAENENRSSDDVIPVSNLDRLSESELAEVSFYLLAAFGLGYVIHKLFG